jgi:hypothetical protein
MSTAMVEVKQQPTQKQVEARLNARITSFIKAATALATVAHELLCDCLRHADTFGDARPLNRLIVGMPKRDRPEAARVWVKKYSPVTWNGDGEVGIVKVTSKLYKPYDHDGAASDPYWTPEEMVAKPLTLQALIQMAQRISTVVEKKYKENLIAEGEDLQAMRMFAARIEEASKVQVVVDNTTLANRQTIADAPAPAPVVSDQPVETPTAEVA